MTLGDLIRHTSLKLGLDDTNGSDEYLLMIDWANEGVRDVLIETRVKLTSGTINLVGGTGDYTITTWLAIDDVQLNSANQQWSLKRVEIRDILAMRRGLVAQSNSAPMFYAVQGDMLMVYPTPATNDTITVYGVKEPTSALSSLTDDLFSTANKGNLPVYAQRAVEYYMLWQGAEYDDKRAPLTPLEYHQMYEADLVKVRKRERRMGGRMLPAARVGYPARNQPTRNDVYPGR